MRGELVQRGPSGAPIAVPSESDAPLAPRRIDGYDQLDEAIFARLLDEVGPRGLGTTVVTLLFASTAATFVLGWLAYGLELLSLVVTLAFLGAGSWGFYALEARRRARRVIEVALELGFSERFAERLASDLELMESWLPKEERPGPLSSWPDEQRALLQALRRVKSA